jgi:hypothetical protein
MVVLSQSARLTGHEPYALPLSIDVEQSGTA